jgi:hypothetical protein
MTRGQTASVGAISRSICVKLHPTLRRGDSWSRRRRRRWPRTCRSVDCGKLRHEPLRRTRRPLPSAPQRVYGCARCAPDALVRRGSRARPRTARRCATAYGAAPDRAPRSRRVFTLPSICPTAGAAFSPLKSLEEALNVVEMALLDVPAGLQQIAENRRAHTTTLAQVGQILHAR